MTSVKVCDQCGQPIERGQDAIIVSVVDLARLRLPTKGQLSKILQGGEPPVFEAQPRNLTVKLDLHRQCYLDHYAPYVDQAESKASDAD